jgi:hypothetical protein
MKQFGAWYDRSHLLTGEQREIGLRLWWRHHEHMKDGEKMLGVGVLIKHDPECDILVRRDEMFDSFIKRQPLSDEFDDSLKAMQ